MPATAEPSAPPAKPTETINVKAMSDKWKAAMAEGGIPKGQPKAVDPAPAPAPSAEPAKAPEAVKPAEPAPAKPAETGVPKPPEKPKPAELVKPAEPAKLPSENFKALEAKSEEYRTKWEAAEKKAKEIEAKLSTAVDPKQIEELNGKLEATQKKADEYETIVQRFYVEHSPQFKKAYDEKIALHVEEAKDAVGAELAGEVEKTFEMRPGKARDERLEELIGEISQFKQNSVIKAYTDLKRTQRERDGELSKSKDNYAKLKEFEEEQAKSRSAEFVKSIQKTYADELQSFSSNLDGFQPIEGKEDYNAIVKENRTRAEQFLSTNPSNPTDRARLAIWASYGVHARALTMAQAERIGKLEAQLAEVQAANPNVRGGVRTSTEQPSKEDKEPGGRAVRKWHEAMEKGIPAKQS